MDKELKILLASPRGFCAGVDRAIEIVKKTLEKFGPPVYVRHEIVHNTQVVENLKKLGAIFVEELDEIKDHSRPVIFSAHGVPKSVPKEASRKNMFYIDATCPLVTKVHREAERHNKNGNKIILIGHKGHPEVIGTMGQIPKENIDEVSKLWELAKETTDGYELYARQIYNSFKNESEILVKILDLLFEIAKSDGIIKSEELNYLEVVSKIFNLDTNYIIKNKFDKNKFINRPKNMCLENKKLIDKFKFLKKKLSIEKQIKDFKKYY